MFPIFFQTERERGGEGRGRVKRKGRGREKNIDLVGGGERSWSTLIREKLIKLCSLKEKKFFTKAKSKAKQNPISSSVI